MASSSHLLWLPIVFTLACGGDKEPGPPGGPVTTAGPPTAASPGAAPHPSHTGKLTDGRRPGQSTAEAPPAAAPSPPAPSSAPPRPAPIDLNQACAQASSDAPPLKLVKLQLTSAVEDKKPVDELTELRSGQKLYAYVEVGSEVDARCVAVRFRFGDRERATLKLDIGRSPRWRTWAHVTASKRDIGKTAEVTVLDDQGQTLSKKTLPVVSDK